MRAHFWPCFLGVLLVGCGGAGKGSPAPIEGPAKEAATVVQELERATAQRDFRLVCDSLLSSAERRQAGGNQCAQLMGTRAQDVSGPRILIRSIEVSQTRALVRVRTSAAGQAPVDDLIRLVRERGRFRIASLGR